MIKPKQNLLLIITYIVIVYIYQKIQRLFGIKLHGCMKGCGPRQQP